MIATCAVLATLVIPVVNLIVYVLLMVPIWWVDGLGFVDLGHENNGFFIVNAAGGVFGVAALWLVCVVLFRLTPVQAPPVPADKDGVPRT